MKQNRDHTVIKKLGIKVIQRYIYLSLANSFMYVTS